MVGTARRVAWCCMRVCRKTKQRIQQYKFHAFGIAAYTSSSSTPSSSHDFTTLHGTGHQATCYPTARRHRQARSAHREHNTYSDSVCSSLGRGLDSRHPSFQTRTFPMPSPTAIKFRHRGLKDRAYAAAAPGMGKHLTRHAHRHTQPHTATHTHTQPHSHTHTYRWRLRPENGGQRRGRCRCWPRIVSPRVP